MRPNGAVHLDLTPLPELGELREVVYWGDGQEAPDAEYLKALTPLALAVWYMDDGSFALRSKGLQERTAGGSGRIEICVQAMSEGSRARLADHLRDTYGIECGSVVPDPRQGGPHDDDGWYPSSRRSSRPTFTHRWSTSCSPLPWAVRRRAGVRRAA